MSKKIYFKGSISHLRNREPQKSPLGVEGRTGQTFYSLPIDNNLH